MITKMVSELDWTISV